jgi:hypothetical protein
MTELRTPPAPAASSPQPESLSRSGLVTVSGIIVIACAAARSLSVSIESESDPGFRFSRIFCGKPVPTPDRVQDHVRGRLFPENALALD